jgi:aminoglycoside phosphotransferase (APT) family kinase protein
MPPLLSTLERRLRQALDEHYPEWGVSSLAPAGTGLEFTVFRAESKALGSVALRAAQRRWESNDNDEWVDTRALLQQEARLLEYVRAHGLPAPRVYALHLGEEFDFLACEFVETDGSRPARGDMGQVLHALHALPPSAGSLVAQGAGPLAVTLSERLLRRAHVAERLASIDLRLPPAREIELALSWPAADSRLLHMDPRPENFLVRAGRVVGLVDWSNALIGDPALELARVAEYGELQPEFAAAYGDADRLERAPPVVQLLYRLDTVAMLAVVFLSEKPDAAAARKQVQRLREVRAQLRPFL